MSTSASSFFKRLCALVLTALLVACGNGAGPGDGEPPAPSGEPPYPSGLATLGAEGGAVTGADGASLTVPPGALADPATFALSTDASDAPPLPPQVRLIGGLWSATPHGALFSTDATVRVPYDASALQPGEEPVLLKGEPEGGWTLLRDVRPEGGFLVAKVRSLSFLQPVGVPVGGYNPPPDPPATQASYSMAVADTGLPSLVPTDANVSIRQQRDPAEPVRLRVSYRIPAAAAVLTQACPAPRRLGIRLLYTPVRFYRIEGQPGNNRLLLDPRNLVIGPLDQDIAGADLGRLNEFEVDVNAIDHPFNPLNGALGNQPRPELPPGGVADASGVQVELQLECNGGGSVIHLPTGVQPIAIARGFPESPVDFVEHPWPLTGQVGQLVQSGFRVQFDFNTWFVREDAGDIVWEAAAAGSTAFTPLPAAAPVLDATGSLPAAVSGYYGTPTSVLGRGTLADNGRLLRLTYCVRRRANEADRQCTSSRAAPITVATRLEAPRFTLQPLSRVHQPGDRLDLLAGYEGLPTPQRVNWQARTSPGVPWVDASSLGFRAQVEPGSPAELRGRSRLLSTGPLALGQAFQFRATYTTTAGTAISNIANITVATGQVAPALLVEPLDVQVASGQAFSLVAASTGGFPLSYQWSRDGRPLTGATGPVLTVTGARPENAGLYRLEVRNSAGRALSRQAQVSLVPTAPQGPQPPVILRPPQPVTAAAGTTVVFSVGLAANSLAPGYQWLRNGAPMVFETGPTLTLANITAADQADYAVRVANSAPSGSVTSAAARLSVGEAPIGPVAPAITAAPTGLTLVPGQTARFSVAATGTAPLVYQWQQNGFDLPGANAAVLELPNVGTAEVGAYHVVVSNAAGSATSAPAGLALAPSGLTVVGPNSVRVQLGENARFTATVVASPAASCQWHRDGNAIAGATSCAELTTGATNAGDNGAVFSLSASSGGRTVTSSAAVLTVVSDVAPTLVQGPADQTTLTGGSATFGALASGSPTPLYLWSLNGSRIAASLAPGVTASFGIGSCTGSVRLGAGGASVTLSSLAAPCAGASVTVRASNAAGQSETGAAALRLSDVPIPTLTTAPLSQTLVAGNDVSFTAAASSAVGGALGFLWEVNGERLALETTASSVSLPGERCFAARGYTRNGGNLQLRGVGPGCNASTVSVRAVDSAGLSAPASATLTVTPGGPATTLSPATASVVAGSSSTDRTSFTARASSEFGNVLGFAWRLNGTLLPTSNFTRFDINGCTGLVRFEGALGQTPVREATLHLSELVEACDGATVAATADDIFGTSAEARATLFVAPRLAAPLVLDPTVTVRIVEGGSISFDVGYTGNPAPTLVWSLAPLDRTTEFTLQTGPFRVASPLVGPDCSGLATIIRSGGRSTLILRQVSRGCTQSFVRRTVTNSLGSHFTGAFLTVDAAPTAPVITQGPQASAINTGGGLTLGATASGNPSGFTWTLGGSTVGGGNFSVGACSGTASAVDGGDGSTQFVLGGLSAGCNGASIAVVAYNSAGASAPASTTLSVQAPTSPPAWALHPASTTVAAGGTAVFTATATGTPAPSYAWIVELAGSSTTLTGGNPGLVLGSCSLSAAVNGGTLSVRNVSEGCDGMLFAALATNSAGSAQSDAALLTVNPPEAPVITAQSPSQQVTEGQTASFFVTATGNALSYQWFRSAQGSLVGMQAIAGATLASYTTPPTRPGDEATSYTVLVCSGAQPGSLSVTPACTLGNLMTLGVTLTGSTTGSCFGGATGWCFQQPAPHGNSLLALAHDPARNRVFVAGAGGMLMHSDDLGSNWAVSWGAGRQQWTDLARLSTGRLVAVHNRLFDENPTPGGVFHSDDDGATWSTGLSAEAMRSVAFADDSIGVAVGQRVYRSGDGGDSWTEVSIPEAVYSVGSPLLRVAYAGNNTFVAVGEAGVVIRSTDGGQTWSKVAVGSGSDTFSHVAFSGTGFGLLVRSFGDVLRSADFGASWAPAGTGFTDARTAAFADGTTAVVLNQFGYAVRSTDAGVTWSAPDFSVDSGQQLWRLAFVSPTLGYALGQYGALLRTGDAGITWRRIAGGRLEHAAEALETSPDRGVTLGIANGCIRRSTDGGRSWSVVRQGRGSLSWGSNSVAMNVELFGGASFSTDGGVNWAGSKWTTDAVYHGGAMATATTAIAVGREPANVGFDTGGFIERSTDGGASWTRVAVPGGDRRWMWAVRFVSPTTGFIGGSRAGLWRTLDGGLSWQALNLPLRRSTDNVQAIAAGPGGAVFVAGDADLLRSTDNGNTWTRVLDASNFGSMKGVAFDAGSQRGIAVGAGGVWRSTDGGLSWTRLNLPLDMLLLAAAWPAPSVALVGGDGGVLLRNAAGGQIVAQQAGLEIRVRALATTGGPGADPRVGRTRATPPSPAAATARRADAPRSMAAPGGAAAAPAPLDPRRDFVRRPGVVAVPGATLQPAAVPAHSSISSSNSQGLKGLPR